MSEELRNTTRVFQDPPPSRAEGQPVVCIRGLLKRFGDKTVLKGINLTVRRGETLVSMGASGC